MTTENTTLIRMVRMVRTGGTMKISGTPDRVRVLVRTATRMRVRLIDDMTSTRKDGLGEVWDVDVTWGDDAEAR